MRLSIDLYRFSVLLIGIAHALIVDKTAEIWAGEHTSAVDGDRLDWWILFARKNCELADHLLWLRLLTAVWETTTFLNGWFIGLECIVRVVHFSVSIYHWELAYNWIILLILRRRLLSVKGRRENIPRFIRQVTRVCIQWDLVSWHAHAWLLKDGSIIGLMQRERCIDRELPLLLLLICSERLATVIVEQIHKRACVCSIWGAIFLIFLAMSWSLLGLCHLVG